MSFTEKKKNPTFLPRAPSDGSAPLPTSTPPTKFPTCDPLQIGLAQLGEVYPPPNQDLPPGY